MRSVVKEQDDFVLALGGGTPCYGNAMQFLEEADSTSIYLKLGIPTLVERLVKEKQHRPLITNISDAELPEFVGKHLFERSPFYARADITLNCEGKTIAEIVGEIADELL